MTQLSEGAAADVFASANNAQMQAAIDNGSISGAPVTFVHNRLAIVTPADNPAGIASPADLGTEGLKLVLAQAEVPVGRYARESVCLMSQDAASYGTDFVARVAGNVVSEEEDVRDVLAKVALGEADAGIVYARMQQRPATRCSSLRSRRRSTSSRPIRLLRSQEATRPSPRPSSPTC